MGITTTYQRAYNIKKMDPYPVEILKRGHTYFIDISSQLLICPMHAKGHSPYYTQYES